MIRAALKIAGNRISEHDWTGIHLSQTMGNHNTFEVVMNQGSGQGALKSRMDAWMGKTITIGFEHAKDSRIDSTNLTELFKGVVTSVGLSKQMGQASILVRGESPTVLMDDGPHMRSFTDAHLNEIVDQALVDYANAHAGFFANAPAIDPERASDALPYTVQYGETAFDFVKRLAAAYGEWFYYDGVNLVFGKRPNGDKIDLDFGASELITFDYSVRLLAGKFQVEAYDYAKNEQIQEPAPGDVASNKLGKAAASIGEDVYSLEPKQFIEHQLTSDEVKLRAQRRKEVALDEVVELTGITRNADLRLGQVVTITDNETGDSHGDFCIIHLDHSINQGGDYSNTFRAVPEGTPPPLTQLPRRPSASPQVAKVVEVADEDGLGRIKVEFDWQRDTAEASPWLRVATHYAGPDKGFYILPEVDDRVMVGFEAGNAEKPYVMGAFYDQEAKPEWFDNDNRYKGFKTAGKNEWRFDDKAQRIELHAPNEMLLTAGNKIHLKTGFKGEAGKEDSEIIIDVAEGTVNITAKIVNVTSAEEVNVTSGKTMLFEAGETMETMAGQDIKTEAGMNMEWKASNMKSEASVKNETKAAQVSIGGQAMVEVKGAMIKLN